jgi:hypothetical protein
MTRKLVQAGHRRTVTPAELKRQLAAEKLENQRKDELIAALQAKVPEEVCPLSDDWTKVDGPELLYVFGDDAKTQAAITQVVNDGQTLYQVTASTKTAFFADLEDAGFQGERWVKPTKAKDVPVVIRKTFESEEQDVGQQPPRELKSEGPASEALDRPSVIVPVGKVYTEDKMELLRFMEEELTVLMHETTNEQDVDIPCVQNDGLTQYFVRGLEQTVKRKFVEILARCKKTSYTSQMYKDADGGDAYRYPSHTAIMFPFSVIHDPSGDRGRVWLRNILNEKG